MFSKFHTFLHSYTHTITDPSYYQDILQAPLFFSIKYFLFFLTILAVATSAKFTFFTKPQIASTISSIISEITTNFPTNLTIAIKDGKLSVEGAQTPLIVPFPTALSDIKHQTDYQNFAVIDPTATVAATNTFVTATETQLIVRNPDGQKQTLYLGDLQDDITINRGQIGMLTSSTQSFIDRLLKFSPYLVFATYLIIMIPAGLISCLIYSIFTYLASRIVAINLTYKKAFQITLHTYSFALTVTFLSNLLNPHLIIPFLFTIAFFGSTLIALYGIKKR